MRDPSHFLPGRKAAAAPPSQVGFLDFLQHLIGGHPGKGLGQGGIPANGQIVIDILGIHAAVGTEDQALLVLVEGDILFMDNLFLGVRVGIEQTLDDLLLLDGLGNNLRNILRLYLEITDFLRVNHDDGAPLTKTVTAGLAKVHLGP